MLCLGVNHGIVPLQVSFHSTRSKCSVNKRSSLQTLLAIWTVLIKLNFSIKEHVSHLDRTMYLWQSTLLSTKCPLSSNHQFIFRQYYYMYRARASWKPNRQIVWPPIFPTRCSSRMLSMFGMTFVTLAVLNEAHQQERAVRVRESGWDTRGRGKRQEIFRESQQISGDAGRGAQGPLKRTAAVGSTQKNLSIVDDIKMLRHWFKDELRDSICLEQMRLHAAAALPGPELPWTAVDTGNKQHWSCLLVLLLCFINSLLLLFWFDVCVCTCKSHFIRQCNNQGISTWFSNMCNISYVMILQEENTSQLLPKKWLVALGLMLSHLVHVMTSIPCAT